MEPAKCVVGHCAVAVPREQHDGYDGKQDEIETLRAGQGQGNHRQQCGDPCNRRPSHRRFGQQHLQHGYVEKCHVI